MDEITAIEDIQRLVRAGFDDWKRYGEVSVRPNDDDTLLIFNYTHAAQYAARWNFFEQVSRGLIIHRETGIVSARAFDKFFNWGEGGRYTAAPMVNLVEKVDGSLGVLYRQRGRYRIATRGSFDGPQALWATKRLSSSYRAFHWSLPDEWTLLFEIVYPDNRIVVDYTDREELVLLAIRNRFTGEYCSALTCNEVARELGLTRPRQYGVMQIDEVIRRAAALGSDEEGYVATFADGQRFKFKGAKYLELQRLLSNLTFKNTLAAVASGTAHEIVERIPDEFLGDFKEWVNQIETVVQDTLAAVDLAFAAAPKENRKEFALWAREHHAPLMHYLFARLDGRPVEPLVYDIAFKNAG